MTFTKHILVFTALMSTAVLAQAKDVSLDEAIKLRDAGSIQAFDKLNALAIAQHPGGVVHETELENQWGRYVYQIELRDAQGLEWDIELDANTGEILKNQQDD
ncbi:peptidase [Cellvibrio mixtus]|uniref:Peptidase n=1 Tax=Cellvibrio mixtus TaxID=39650 RepID=A0A266QBU9_9GAMM|nr:MULTISPECIES: PepSY domain-containing protein [Cellvibrio]AQT61055.1 peptidase [Cellvibrio sp. PSBB023]OZY87363.1 peptidase [Cellvibrio mixtus]